MAGWYFGGRFAFRWNGAGKSGGWTGPSAGESAYYPCVLVINDLRSGTVWRIQTDRSNSEPLLASDNSVYYRVEDRILRAELLQNGQVGAPALLAQSDELRDAHWAFLGPR